MHAGRITYLHPIRKGLPYENRSLTMLLYQEHVRIFIMKRDFEVWFLRKCKKKIILAYVHMEFRDFSPHRAFFVRFFYLNKIWKREPCHCSYLFISANANLDHFEVRKIAAVYSASGCRFVMGLCWNTGYLYIWNQFRSLPLQIKNTILEKMI